MALTDKQTFLRHIDQFDKRAPRDAFHHLRQPARARFRALAFPTPRAEDWRFTSLAPLLKTPFELPQGEGADETDLPLASSDGIARLVFVNGAFAPKLSRLDLLPAGVQAGSLAQIRADQAERLEGVLGLADVHEHVFTALNASFLGEGAFVILPAGKSVAAPIEVLYMTHSQSRAIVHHPRTVVIAGAQSRATLVERYQGAGDAAYFTNAVTEISLGDGAVLDHYKLQEENRAAFHIANTQLALGASSNFTTHYLALGGGLVRNEVRVRFDGQGAEATVNGLYLGGGSQHLDNYTLIDHAQPRCASHELYKGVLRDQAHGVFNGKIIVREGAQKTDAKQTNKVLLLSANATINTKPQLEIFADDVKCTHGATVGQLDAEGIFYLRSRGIGLDEARALLTFAFANDIVARVKVETIRENLERRLLASEPRP